MRNVWNGSALLLMGWKFCHLLNGISISSHVCSFGLGGVLENAVTRFLGSISMELYLSHMMVFRIIEKSGIHQIVGNGWIQYIITVTIVLAGTVGFAVTARKILSLLEGCRT